MNGKARFGKLLEPFHIGRVQTKNRMIKTGAETSLTDESGYITTKYKALYEALARGGVGLIIIESCTVDYPLGSLRPNLLRIDNDKYISSFSELTEVIHKHGCPTFLQLLHAGPWHGALFRGGAQVPQWHSGLQPVSSSSLTKSELPEHGFETPRALATAEIQEIVDKFATAAERAQKAGFDGVEINAGTSHLLNSFLSRIWNKRQDAYGCGSLESRARFVIEIIREIKKRLGQDFVVTALINVAEFGVDKGTTIEEGRGFAKMLQDVGADAIQARAFGYGDFPDVIRPDQVFYPEPPKPLPKELDWSRKGAGALVPLAAAIKKVVSIPVITVGRLNPILGEQILQQGKADFIGLTRRLMADPELPNKIAAGRLEDIAPCTACLHCASAVSSWQPVVCRVNAALGKEPEEYVIKQAGRRKRVVVVGGGPAGMEAARVAAIRGHEVILYEKEHKLGGSLPLAAMVRGLEIEDLVDLVRYLKTQITNLGVKIRLGKEFTPALIEEIKPEVLILATGGIPSVPEIPGINRRNVVSGPELHQRLKIYLRFLGPKVLRWLTRFWMPLGKRVAIIGGAIHGCELAEFLVKRGRRVTIVDTAETLGAGLTVKKWSRLLMWLAKRGVTMVPGAKYEEITDKGLVVITKEGKRQTIEADTIVTALPFRPNTELRKALEGKVPEIYAIGDCSEPRLIIDAIADGYRISRAI